MTRIFFYTFYSFFLGKTILRSSKRHWNMESTRTRINNTFTNKKDSRIYFCYLSRGWFPKNILQQIYIFCQNTNFCGLLRKLQLHMQCIREIHLHVRSRVDNFFFGIGILENCVVECCKREIAKKLAKKGCLKNP